MNDDGSVEADATGRTSVAGDPHARLGSGYAVRLVLRDARLRARPFTYDDLEAFVAYRQHPDVERYQSWSGYTLEQGRPGSAVTASSS